MVSGCRCAKTVFVLVGCNIVLGCSVRSGYVLRERVGRDIVIKVYEFRSRLPHHGELGPRALLSPLVIAARPGPVDSCFPSVNRVCTLEFPDVTASFFFQSRHHLGCEKYITAEGAGGCEASFRSPAENYGQEIFSWNRVTGP